MANDNIWRPGFPSYDKATKVEEGQYIVGVHTPKYVLKMMRIEDKICIGFTTENFLFAYGVSPAFDIIFEEDFTEDNYIRACEFWIDEIAHIEGE